MKLNTRKKTQKALKKGGWFRKLNCFGRRCKNVRNHEKNNSEKCITNFRIRSRDNCVDKYIELSTKYPGEFDSKYIASIKNNLKRKTRRERIDILNELNDEIDKFNNKKAEEAKEAEEVEKDMNRMGLSREEVLKHRARRNIEMLQEKENEYKIHEILKSNAEEVMKIKKQSDIYGDNKVRRYELMKKINENNLLKIENETFEGKTLSDILINIIVEDDSEIFVDNTNVLLDIKQHFIERYIAKYDIDSLRKTVHYFPKIKVRLYEKYKDNADRAESVYDYILTALTSRIKDFTLVTEYMKEDSYINLHNLITAGKSRKRKSRKRKSRRKTTSR